MGLKEEEIPEVLDGVTQWLCGKLVIMIHLLELLV